jgi:hypothetical protein
MSTRLPPGRLSGSEYICTECPACHGKNKLYFNLTIQVGYCFGGACGLTIHGFQDLEDAFAGRMEELSYMGARSISSGGASRLSMVIPGDPWASPVARKFLSSRGITETVVRAVPLGLRGKSLTTLVDPLSREYPKEIIVRSEDGSGKWLNPRAGFARSHYCFGWEAARRQHAGRELIILEGVMDLLALGLMGRAVAILGTDFPRDLAIRMSEEGMRRGVLFFDADAAGQKAREKGTEMLKSEGVESRIISLKGDPKLYDNSDIMEVVE